MLNMRTYDLMATPLVYPGQTVKARVATASQSRGDIEVRLRARVYDKNDQMIAVESEPRTIASGEDVVLEWQLPDTGGQPIEIGRAHV